jgi:hypothetical protein
MKAYNFKDLTPDVLKKAAEYIDKYANVELYKPDSSYGYKYKISIMMDSPDIADWMFYHFNGYRESSPCKTHTNHWINLQQRRAIKVGEMLLPYLKDKKELIRRLIEFRDVVKAHNKSRLTDEVRSLRQRLHAEFMAERKRAYDAQEYRNVKGAPKERVSKAPKQVFYGILDDAIRLRAADLIDKGFISFNLSVENPSPRYSIRVRSMIKEDLQFLADTFCTGGGIYEIKDGSGLHAINLAGPIAIKVLQSVLGILVDGRESADLVLKMSNNMAMHRYKKVSPEQLRWRLDLLAQINEVNRNRFPDWGKQV